MVGGRTTGAVPYPFIDRKDELARLSASFEKASTGHFQVALVLGEPGAGKTALTLEFSERYRDESIQLTAVGYPYGATTSFGLWIDALDQHLVRLQSEQAAAPPQLTPHQRLSLAISRVLRDLAQRAPMIVTLDDAHHADASSIDTLAYLANQLRECRVLVIVCARTVDFEMNARARQLILGLDKQEILTRLPIPPLEHAETAGLLESRLGRMAPTVLVDRVFEASRGNPFYAIRLLEALLENHTALAAPCLPDLPAAITEQVLAQLAPLTASARSTLEVLAVAGHSIPSNWLARLTRRIRPTSTLDDLRELRTRHLVIEALQHGQVMYAVDHPLVREAIYQSIPLDRRQEIHRQVARALVQQDRLGQAAEHYVQSAAAGDDEAIETLIRALAQCEAQQSPHEVMVMLRGLLKLLPHGDPRWANVLDAMIWDAAWILDYIGFASSEVGFLAMKEIDHVMASSPDSLRRAVVQLRLGGFTAWDLQHSDDAARACTQALAVFEQKGQRRLAIIARYWLAWIAGIVGDLAAMEARSREVLAMADDAADDALIVHAEGALGWALLRRGQFREAERALWRAIERADTLGDLHQRAGAVSTLAYLYALEGRRRDDPELVQRTGQMKSEAADPRLIGASVLLHGNASEAFETLRAAAGSASNAVGAEWAWSLVFGTMAAARLGRHEEAQAWVAAMHRHDGRIGFGWESFRSWAEGIARHEQGDSAAALALLRKAARESRHSGYVTATALILSDAAEAASELLDATELIDITEGLNDLSAQLGTELHGALAELAMAQLHLVQLDRRAAAEAEHAETTFQRLGYSDWEARALQVRAAAVAPSSPAAAAECLARVVEISTRGGILRRREMAVRALDQLGRAGIRVASMPGEPSTLTQRERQVARLAVEGLSAREIGRRLHISRRTVESHLATAYRKLSVQSRLELVRRATDPVVQTALHP